MAIDIATQLFEILFDEFLTFIKEKTGENFTAFSNSSYVEVEENYKYSVYDAARAELQADKWREKDVGTGRIKDAVGRSMIHDVVRERKKYINNLLDWRKIQSFRTTRFDSDFEMLVFNFFKNKISSEQAYSGFLRHGLEYQTIAYIYFTKDREQFLPIAQETFDFIIREKLGIEEFKTSRSASWENYSEFLQIVRNTRRFLRTKEPKTTLLDAHSFLWILGRQREDWIRGTESGHRKLAESDDEMNPQFQKLDTANNYLQFWHPDQIESGIQDGVNLLHAGSNQFERRKIKPGDVIWIVTVEDGDLILAGRIEVDELISYAEAKERFDDDVFEKNLHIVAHPERAEAMRKVALVDIANELRFAETDRNRLEMVAGRIDARQLQAIRKLEQESVRLIESKWRVLGNQFASSELEDDIAEREIQSSDLPELEKEQLVLARRGQGLFRKNLSSVESSCRLTSVSDKRFLIASHIKPWRLSTPEEKVDGSNGFWLSPHVDKLFDNGWITFSDEGEIRCHSDEVEILMRSWGLDPHMNVGTFSENQKRYLAAHRELFNFFPE